MAELYDSYGRLTYSVILRMVTNSAVAEDLVQETFLRVWNGARLYNAQRGPMGAWILTIARNRAVDYLRSNECRLASASVDLEWVNLTTSQKSPRPNSPLDGALSIDSQRRLERAARSLTSMQRKVLELAYFEGFSQTEISTRLNQPLGTIKTWTRNALRELRYELERTEGKFSPCLTTPPLADLATDARQLTASSRLTT